MASPAWSRFGQVHNYIEPFCGSAAVLLGRPEVEGAETINDAHAWLTNAYRAIQYAPEAVAWWDDWPVSELDCHARGDALYYRKYDVKNLCSLRGGAERCPFETECPYNKNGGPKTFQKWMQENCTNYCACAGGVWLWLVSCGIGHGWNGPQSHNAHKDETGEAVGVAHSRSSLSNNGMGVNRRGITRGRPNCDGHGDRGVNRQLPHIGDAGQGVNRQRPNCGYNCGVDSISLTDLTGYMNALSARLRKVRVCCGDWKRILGPACFHDTMTAVFLDPPYSDLSRDKQIYGEHEDMQIANAVREWAIANGSDPLKRIALCGYEGEHAMPDDWECFAWKSQGGYAGYGKDHKENRHKERIWFSPHCLRPEASLFDGMNE